MQEGPTVAVKDEQDSVIASNITPDNLPSSPKASAKADSDSKTEQPPEDSTASQKKKQSLSEEFSKMGLKSAAIPKTRPYFDFWKKTFIPYKQESETLLNPVLTKKLRDVTAENLVLQNELRDNGFYADHYRTKPNQITDDCQGKGVKNLALVMEKSLLQFTDQVKSRSKSLRDVAKICGSDVTKLGVDTREKLESAQTRKKVTPRT